MIGELNVPLSPLRPGLRFAADPQDVETKSQRSEETREFRLTGLSGGNADKWRNTNGPRNDGAKRTNLSAGSAYVPHDPSELTGGESTWVEPPQDQRARNHGQLPEGRHGFRAVCLGDWATSGLEEWRGDRGNMLGVPGPLVHPGLRARSRKSVDGCHLDYFSPVAAVMEISTCQGQ